jgi:hypothetical protein
MDETFIMGVTAKYTSLCNIINTTGSQQQT